jgi:hypothetical protein
MCKEAELNCVRMYICLKPELIQFEIGISTIRCFPPNGTAGFDLSSVNGNNLVPFPPPRIIDNTFGIFSPKKIILFNLL